MRLREVINNLQEAAWTSHKELANILYKHTGNKQLAIDFFHLETEFDSQDDMQSTGLSALDIDPFASDRERVNNILSINNVPVKVLKMKHNDAYETLYSLLQSAPVSESREELSEIDFKKAAATAMAIGSLAGAPQDAQASTDAAQGVDSNQPVATQQVSQPDEPVKPKASEFTGGMSIDQVAELSNGKVRPNGIGVLKLPGFTLAGGSGMVDNKDLKVYAKINGVRTYFEFDGQDKLVGIHKAYIIDRKSPIKKGEGLMGFKRAELGKVFNKAYQSVKDIAGTPTSKAQSSDGGGIGMGVGGVTSSGKGVALGLDKVGQGSAWVKTTNGYMALDYMTQKGAVNNFRPAVVMVGTLFKTTPSDYIDFE